MSKRAWEAAMGEWREEIRDLASFASMLAGFIPTIAWLGGIELLIA
jgi:hypothetical protein